jgi:hypothetical protein
VQICLFGSAWQVPAKATTRRAALYSQRRSACSMSICLFFLGMWFFFPFLLLWCWRLNPGLYACYASILPLNTPQPFTHPSIHSFIQTGSREVAQGGLKFTILLFSLPSTWNYRTYTIHSFVSFLITISCWTCVTESLFATFDCNTRPEDRTPVVLSLPLHNNHEMQISLFCLWNSANSSYPSQLNVSCLLCTCLIFS